jgi:hypothetical protein
LAGFQVATEDWRMTSTSFLRPGDSEDMQRSIRDTTFEIDCGNFAA